MKNLLVNIELTDYSWKDKIMLMEIVNKKIGENNMRYLSKGLVFVGTARKIKSLKNERIIYIRFLNNIIMIKDGVFCLVAI